METAEREEAFTVMEPVTTYQHQLCRPGQIRRSASGHARPDAHAAALAAAGRRRSIRLTGAIDLSAPRFDLGARAVPGRVSIPSASGSRTSWPSKCRRRRYVQRVVTRKVPVQVGRMVDEEVVRKVPVQVCRMVQEEQVRRVPVTTYRQVVERVQQQTPVQVCKMVEEEVVRRIPVTTCRMVTEETRRADAGAGVQDGGHPADGARFRGWSKSACR